MAEDNEWRRRSAEDMKGVFERRATTDTGLEVRGDNGTLTFSGYAATFNTVYNLGSFQERILPTALDRCLSADPGPDCVFNADHGRSLSGLPLARSRSATGGPGSLELGTDDHGLFFRALLDADDPDAQALARAVRNGTMRQCSFAFRCNRDTYSQDGNLRTLEDITIHGGHVSCVAMPANSETSISVRAAELAARQPIVIPDLTTRARERVAQLRATGDLPESRSSTVPSKALVDRLDPDYYRNRLAELRRGAS